MYIEFDVPEKETEFDGIDNAEIPPPGGAKENEEIQLEGA